MSVIDFIVDNASLLARLATGHTWLSLVSVVVAIVIAVPSGIVMGHMHRFSYLAINGSNLLRALPTLALVAIGITIYGLGFANIAFALVVLAFPLIMTNTYTAVAQADRGMVEAARGMGMSEIGILLRVELPTSIPLIMSGVRTAWVYVVATAYLAGFAGASGTLGDIINVPESYHLAGVMAAGIVSVVIAFAGDALLALAQKLLTPNGLRVSRASGITA